MWNFTPLLSTILYFVGLVQMSLQCVPRVLAINVRAQSWSYYRDRIGQPSLVIVIRVYTRQVLKKIIKKQINGLVLDSRRRINIINIQYYIVQLNNIT